MQNLHGMHIIKCIPFQFCTEKNWHIFHRPVLLHLLFRTRNGRNLKTKLGWDCETKDFFIQILQEYEKIEEILKMGHYGKSGAQLIHAHITRSASITHPM